MNKGKVFLFGLQYVLVMYGGVIVVLFIVGGVIGLIQQQFMYLVVIDLFMCGVVMLL